MSLIKIIYIIFSLLSALFYSHSAISQPSYLPVYHADTTIYKKYHSLWIHAQTTCFLKNDEYFYHFAQGHTLFGYRLSPYISFYPSQHVRTDIGICAKKYFGSSKFFEKIYPIFRIKYTNNKIKLLFGTFEKNIYQKLIPPLFHAERLITKKLASGLHGQYKTSKMLLNIWLHWLKMIKKHPPTPEKLIAGCTYTYKYNHHNHWTFSIPLQTLVYHVGGQGKNFNVYSLFMTAIGTTLHIPISLNKIINNIAIKQYCLFSYYNNIKINPLQKGSGSYSQVTFQTKLGDLSLSYWHGNNFSSDNLGTLLYQSIALKDGKITYQEKKRALFFFTISKQWKIINNMTFHFNFSPYYDIKNKIFEQSAALYIVYSSSFFVKNI